MDGSINRGSNSRHFHFIYAYQQQQALQSQELLYSLQDVSTFIGDQDRQQGRTLSKFCSLPPTDGAF